LYNPPPVAGFASWFRAKRLISPLVNQDWQVNPLANGAPLEFESKLWAVDALRSSKGVEFEGGSEYSAGALPGICRPKGRRYEIQLWQTLEGAVALELSSLQKAASALAGVLAKSDDREIHEPSGRSSPAMRSNREPSSISNSPMSFAGNLSSGGLKRMSVPRQSMASRAVNFSASRRRAA